MGEYSGKGLMGERVRRVNKPSQDERIHEAQRLQSQQHSARLSVLRQITSEGRIAEQAGETMVFSDRDFGRRFRPLHEQVIPKSEPQKSEAQKPIKSHAQEGSDSAAEKVSREYCQRNPEFQKKTLLILAKYIKPDDTHDVILEKLQKFYIDKYLQHEALDFLIDVEQNKLIQTREGHLRRLFEAKTKLLDQYGREVRAGYNTATYVRAFSERGLKSPTGLRKLYCDVIANPRTAQKLFDELAKKFKFSDMKNIIDFILHSLGADVKAKGPSISRAELQRLCEEARTMQAILGLFRFFYSRMSLIKNQFDRAALVIPRLVNFDVLSRLLMVLLQERYPTTQKVIKLASALEIAEEVAAQIIVFTQYRDAMRNISPRLFKSERHRQEVLLSLIETLSDLEDEEEEKEKEKGKEGKKEPFPHQKRDTLE